MKSQLSICVQEAHKMQSSFWGNRDEATKYNNDLGKVFMNQGMLLIELIEQN